MYELFDERQTGVMFVGPDLGWCSDRLPWLAPPPPPPPPDKTILHQVTCTVLVPLHPLNQRFEKIVIVNKK